VALILSTYVEKFAIVLFFLANFAPTSALWKRAR